ncbi:acyl carrier protein [Streptomyces sp. NPDC048337]|uniref:acyl carrier protein n=1 Tax=Streptomyces sp. NPDC048337 TaxID=3365535 RepID=UPI0037131D02
MTWALASTRLARPGRATSAAALTAARRRSYQVRRLLFHVTATPHRVHTPAAADGPHSAPRAHGHRNHEWMSAMSQTSSLAAPALDKEELRRLVADVLDLDAAEVTDDAHFVDDLEVDSLMALEITVSLEREYSVKMSEAEITGITSLQGTFELLNAKLAEAAAA